MKFFYLFASSLMLLSTVSCGGNAPKTAQNDNPFFAEWTENYGIPPFDKIKEEHYMPAIEEGMKQHNQEIDAIIKNRAVADFDNTIVAYTSSGKFLNKVTSVFSNMTGSDLTESMSQLQDTLQPMISTHYSAISLNDGLFVKIKEVYENQDKFNLSDEQKRLLQKVFDGFARSGANLSAEDKLKFKALNERETVLTMQYGNNLMKENATFKLVIENKDDLAGLPQSSIDAAAEMANANSLEGKFMFNLSGPSYLPFMTYAQNRELRQKMFEGYANRSTENNSNNSIVEELSNIRVEKAKLLGFDNYASYVLDKNMAKEPKNVYDLIESIWTPAIKQAKTELKDMQVLMAKEGVKGDFMPWDWWFYAEKVRGVKYSLDENMVKPYFEINNVRDGVFLLLNKLFGVSFELIADAPKYHPDMQAYKVTENGKMLGVLTLDMHPRATKRGGAWCSSFRKQSYDAAGNRVHPIVPVVCNFTAPTADAPALLSLDETTTFFHEIGHAIQSLLQDVKLQGLAGTSRDFVELPSQILEAWAMHPDFLVMYAKHYKTGEAIPADLIAKIDNSSKFNVGFTMSEFLAAAYLDMEYHTLSEKTDFKTADFETASMKKLGLIDEIIPRYRSTYFTHIFNGGYASGYYGYKWADVLVADAFQAFVATGDIFNPELCSKYRSKILEPWGTKSEMEMYVDFRGAEPDKKHLMERIF